MRIKNVRVQRKCYKFVKSSVIKEYQYNFSHFSPPLVSPGVFVMYLFMYTPHHFKAAFKTHSICVMLCPIILSQGTDHLYLNIYKSMPKALSPGFSFMRIIDFLLIGVGKNNRMILFKVALEKNSTHFQNVTRF